MRIEIKLHHKSKIVCLVNYCNFDYCKYTKMDIRQHATSNHMHRFTCHYVISGLGPPRPRRPLAFICPALSNGCDATGNQSII